MENLQLFNFKEKKIRVSEVNGEAWFCLKDVCAILEITNQNNVASRLNQKGVHTMDTPTNGGIQQMNFINESNLYKVIFQSRKEEAEAFTEYITGTILPTIRKHGAYMTEEVLEKALMNPDFLIQLATELKIEKEKRKQLEIENGALKPKAEYFDCIVDRNLLTNFRETAKEFKIKEREFIEMLKKDKFIYKDKKGVLMPYAENNDGLFELKEYVSQHNNWKGVQTLITPKGRETFRLLYANKESQ